MEKNETKPKETAKVAVDKAADAKEAVAESTQSEKPIEKTYGQMILSDDPTAVAVTVLVLLTSDENDAFLLRHSLRSLHQNLRGVAANVKVIGKKKPEWLAEDTWLDVSNATDSSSWNSIICRALTLVENERVILMTDRMFLLQPVNLADIALLKAEVSDNGNKTVKMVYDEMGTTKHKVWNYHANMPVLLYKRPLTEVLDFMLNKRKLVEFDLPTVYFNFVYPDIRPTLLDWSTDGWLLPVISEHPDLDRAKSFLATKKFMHIANKYGEEVVALLKFLTPSPLVCETDIENENPTED